jgi:hypothetical protein
MTTLKTLLTLTIVACITSCSNKPSEEENNVGTVSPEIVNIPATASGNAGNNKTPKFEFEKSNFDFGTITSGEQVSTEFKFKNIGDADLVISQVKGSCGCTEPEYSKEAIAPGAEGVIKVTYKSEGMSGQITKTVTILANTLPNTKVLTISGEVLKKK